MIHALRYSAPIPAEYNAAFLPQNQRGYPDSISNQLTLNEAITYLEHELSRLGASRATIHSSYEEIKTPQLRKQLRNDSAIIVDFTINDKDYRLFSGAWQLIDHNLYAAHMVLRQIQTAAKWRTSSLEQLLEGFKLSTQSFASPSVATEPQTAPQPAITDWMKELGLGPTATGGDISAIYHRRAKLCETEDELLQLNAIVDEARKSVV